MRGKRYSEIKVKLDKYYSVSSPFYGIPIPVRPNEITTPEMINKIHDIVLNDLKVKVREIAEIVSTPTERVVSILHIHLFMRKLCSRWVQRLPTIDQKCIRMTTS